jgi:hypothetical protein
VRGKTRYDDGFVAPIVACLYDDEGVLEDADRSSAAVQLCYSQSSRGGRLCYGRCVCLTGGRIPRQSGGNFDRPSRRRLEWSMVSAT